MGMDMGTLMSLLMSNRSGGMGPPPIDVNKYFNPNGGPCPPGSDCPKGDGKKGGPDMNAMLMQLLMSNMMHPAPPQRPCPPNDHRPPPPPPRPTPPCCGFAPVSPWCGHEVLFCLNLLCRGCLVRF